MRSEDHREEWMAERASTRSKAWLDWCQERVLADCGSAKSRETQPTGKSVEKRAKKEREISSTGSTRVKKDQREQRHSPAKKLIKKGKKEIT